MAGIAHLGIGLAAKQAAPKINLGVLLLTSEALDILWGIFALAGIENMQYSPWSHGLLMAIVWSVIGATAAWRIYRDGRSGLVIGLIIFSHWVLDFITHPMFGGPPDLPLLFADSPKVGLGLYYSAAPGLLAVFELGFVLVGLVVYLRGRGIFKRNLAGKTG